MFKFTHPSASTCFQKTKARPAPQIIKFNICNALTKYSDPSTDNRPKVILWNDI